jgi:hypothetical protein
LRSALREWIFAVATSTESSPPAALDFITICQASGALLTKTVNRSRPLDQMFGAYGNAYSYNLWQVPINNLEGIGDLLAGSLINETNLCAVYGQIIDPARATGVRKLSRRCSRTGYEPTIRA